MSHPWEAKETVCCSAWREDGDEDVKKIIFGALVLTPTPSQSNKHLRWWLFASEFKTTQCGSYSVVPQNGSPGLDFFLSCSVQSRHVTNTAAKESVPTKHSSAAAKESASTKHVSGDGHQLNAGVYIPMERYVLPLTTRGFWWFGGVVHFVEKNLMHWTSAPLCTVREPSWGLIRQRKELPVEERRLLSVAWLYLLHFWCQRQRTTDHRHHYPTSSRIAAIVSKA